MRVFEFISVLLAILLMGCAAPAPVEKPDFVVKTAWDQAEMMWARTAADISGNGINDIVVSNGNAFGGWIGWFETAADLSEWTLHIICDSATIGGTIAGGDIATGDFNNNGKTDIVAFVHPGEWENSNAPTTVYWLENPCWTPHYVGEVPAFAKDVEVADFNNDGRYEIAVITFDRNSLQVFKQGEEGWYEVLSMVVPNLHEGMATGDIDGDGYIDIATNGYWLRSPGGDLTGEWELYNIDPKWNNQEGDWQRNATKVFCADIDNDGRAEVFISHSESRGYPVSYYKLIDLGSNTWEEIVIDTIDGCHTLQVFDFNGNGYKDILAGQNSMRWDDDVAPVNLYLNSGDNLTFTKVTLTGEGCYNCIAADLAGNGFYDIIRTAGHGSEVLEIWINLTLSRSGSGRIH